MSLQETRARSEGEGPEGRGEAGQDVLQAAAEGRQGAGAAAAATDGGEAAHAGAGRRAGQRRGEVRE